MIAEPIAPDALRFLEALWQPGDVREVRIPRHDKWGHTASGYFATPEAAAGAIEAWDGKAAGLYVTLNPVNPALRARAADRIIPDAKSATADLDILRRRWLLVDVDPVRPAGISSTDDELAAALAVMKAAAADLRARGWPNPISGMSGNGYHALYPVDLPNDAESLAIVHGVLAYLAETHNTPAATIDRTVDNAARISAILGTLKMKGDDLPGDRPHRRAELLKVPTPAEPVPLAALRAVAAVAPLTPARAPVQWDGGMPAGWVTDLLDARGIAYRLQPPDAAGIVWHNLEHCPFHEDGAPFTCGVGESPGGKAAGHCMHNRGTGNGWQEFRDALGLGPAWPGIVDAGTAGRQAPAAVAAGAAVPTIGSRTGRDLRHGDAPPQLAGAFLTSEGPTVLYARGGTGKGLLACWFARDLVRAGHVVMVVDFEGHEMEWGSRLRGLGLTDDELGRIHYRAPFGSDWTAPTGSLATVADAIRDDAAREYFSGLARIGLPSLTIAHVRGDSGKFPERPFGSVFVHNLARETWAVERIGDDDPDAIDPDEIRFGPYVVALELRNKKANARPKSAAQFVTFSFFADGTIEVVTDGPAGRSVADLAADALADGPLTLAKIAAAIKEDTGQAVSADTLRNALKRHPQRFEQSTSGRPRTWAVR